MYKQILSSSVILLSLSSGSVFANDIEDLYKDLKQSLESEKSSSIVEYDDLDIIAKEINSINQKNEVDSESLSLEKKVTDNKVSDHNIDKNFDSIDYNLDKLNSIKETEETNEQYLKYFPIDTSFVFNYDIYIPRNKNTFIYSKGERVLSVTKSNFNLCYIKFNDYEKPRKISKGRKVYVDSNITNKIKVKSTNQNIYFTTFGIDNEHISYIKCMSDENEKPMTLNDLYKNFGNLINVELPEYEQI